MTMEVTQFLLNAQSIDGSVRKQAEENLKHFEEQNFPTFLLSLSGELANDAKPVDSRRLAGLILKNILDAKEQNRKVEQVQRWLSLESSLRAQVKGCLLQTLSSPTPDAQSTASQVIAKIAAIELPPKQWPELVESLLSNVHQNQPHIRQATLETLGYLCEEVSSDVVDQDQVNKILTAVIQGMNATEANMDIRIAATRALYNALGFAEANFTNDMERDFIMRVVCEATVSSDVPPPRHRPGRPEVRVLPQQVHGEPRGLPPLLRHLHSLPPRLGRPPPPRHAQARPPPQAQEQQELETLSPSSS